MGEVRWVKVDSRLSERRYDGRLDDGPGDEEQQIEGANDPHPPLQDLICSSLLPRLPMVRSECAHGRSQFV